MSGENRIFTYFITIVAVLLVLLLPMPIKEEYRIFGIAILLFIFIAIVLSEFNSKLSDYKIEQKRIGEKFKIYDRLSRLEARIEVMKND